MYLEAKFEDGAVGFYPVTSSSTITITEPAPNDSSAAPSVAFATEGVQSITLLDGNPPNVDEPATVTTTAKIGDGTTDVVSTTPAQAVANANDLATTVAGGIPDAIAHLDAALVRWPDDADLLAAKADLGAPTADPVVETGPPADQTAA